MKVKEPSIQRTFIRYLNMLPNCIALEFYNQAKYSLKLKRFLPTSKALRPKGTPDIIGILDRKTFWIEVKTATGRLKPEQVSTHERFNRLGWPVFVCRTMDDLKMAISRIESVDA